MEKGINLGILGAHVLLINLDDNATQLNIGPSLISGGDVDKVRQVVFVFNAIFSIKRAEHNILDVATILLGEFLLHARKEFLGCLLLWVPLSCKPGLPFARWENIDTYGRLRAVEQNIIVHCV